MERIINWVFSYIANKYSGLRTKCREVNSNLRKMAVDDCCLSLRLDNTRAKVVEVNPSLICNQMSDNVELYIKLKLRIFSIVLYYSHSKVMVSSEIVNLKAIFQLYFFPWTYFTQFSIKMNETFRTCTEGLYAGKRVSDFIYRS